MSKMTVKTNDKVKKGDLIGYIGGLFGSEQGATYMEFRYVE